MAIWVLPGKVGFAIALLGKPDRTGNAGSICQLTKQGSRTTVSGTLVNGIDAEIFFSLKPSLRKTHIADCLLILIFTAWAPEFTGHLSYLKAPQCDC